MYRTATGHVPDSYRTCTGQLQDSYRTDTGHVPDMYQTCTGKACRTVTGQATGHFHRTPTGQSFSLSVSSCAGVCCRFSSHFVGGYIVLIFPLCIPFSFVSGERLHAMLGIAWLTLDPCLLEVCHHRGASWEGAAPHACMHTWSLQLGVDGP